MKKYSVITILKTFSKKEIQQFEEFIKTPYHNKNTKVIRLFDELKIFHPEYSEEVLSKENLFKNMAGNVRYKESYIRNLFSDLNILAETFLQFSLMNKNINSEKLFIEELKNRDLYDLAEKKIRAFDKKINAVKTKDQNYYLDKNFVFEIMSFLIVDKTLTDNFRNEQILNTIKLFMITLMENSLYLIIEEQRVNIKHDYGFLKQSVDYIKDHLKDFDDSHLLMIYYYLWMCFFYEDDTGYFLKARKYFKKHFSSFSRIDKKNIYSAMQVFYINKIDGGNTSYKKEFLSFLLEMIKFNVLSHKENDSINLNLYRNILILCTMQKETEILKKFIYKYSNYVEAGSRNTILAYSIAHLSFLEKDFEKALELCNGINFNELLKTTNDNIYFKNDVKTLIMKCLYELNAFESAISHIDAFKHYVNHSKLIKEATRKKYKNFLNFVNDIIKLKIKFEEIDFNKLKSKINSGDFIQTEWLNEKIKEMENNEQ